MQPKGDSDLSCQTGQLLAKVFATIVNDEYNASIPVVAPRLFAMSEFTNKNRFSLSLRQPPAVEYLTMLSYAMGSAESRCTAFTVLTRSFIDTSQISVVLQAQGYPAPLIISLPYPATIANLTFSVSDVLNQWAASTAGYGGFIPPCALMFIMPDDAIAILGAMYADSRFNMASMTFFASALTSSSVWNTSAFGTAPFARVRFVTNFASPQSTTIPLSVRYRAALNSYLTTLNVSALPSQLTYTPMLATPTYPGLEGYMAVRWAAEILSRMPSITQTGFLDAVYSRNLFFMDGVTLGPMTTQCVEPNTLKMPCFCNFGSSTLEIGSFNLTNGVATSKTYDSVELAVGRQILPVSQCYLTSSNMRSPLLIGMWTEWNPTGTAAIIYAAFVTLIRQLSTVYNSGGQLPNNLISAVQMNSVMPYQAGESKLTYFNRMYATRRPIYIIGEEFTNVSAAVMNIAVSSTVVLEDDPFTTAGSFDRYTWALTNIFADMAHVMSNYIADTYGVTYGSRPPRVVVISDEAAVQQLAVKSLHTFQIEPETPSQRDLSFVTMLALVRDAAATAAAGQRTIFMVGSRNSTVFVIALMAVAMIPDAQDANSLFAKNFVVVIPASPEFMLSALLSVNATALRNVPILFTSAYMPFWEPGNAFQVRAATLLQTTSPVILSVSSLYIAIVMFDLFTTLVEAANVALPTATNIADAMYKLHSVTVGGMILGPVYDDVCSPHVIAQQAGVRTCQCYKLLQNFGVYDFRDWMQFTANHQINYQWSMGGCSVVYQPLIVPTKLNAALIAGCAAAGGVVLIASVFYLACCFGRRNNRFAPKDPNEPFAMVFTDIQSSTSLWARTPEAMSEGLDQHHNMLRDLVSRHSGYEVKTIGDCFMVAFKSASDATRFGLAIQTELFAAEWDPDIDDVYIALASEAYEEKMLSEDSKKRDERRKAEAGKVHQWDDPNNYPLYWNGIRVRVGMHWGMGSIKLDPVSQGYDYYGTLVNTAARVEGVGNGGQVLATHDFYVQLESEGMNLSHVDVKPLGPQPLRGLDQPVPLYQLCPMELRSREFAELRLDIEIDVDDTTTDTNTDSGTVSTVPYDDTPMAMMARLLKRQKNAGQMFDYLSRVAQFMETLLRTSPISYRKDTIKHYLKKWHVLARKPKDNREPPETTMAYDLAALVVRVGLAAEEAVQQASSSHGSTANRDATSDHSNVPRRRRSNPSPNFIRVKAFNDHDSGRPL
ncbi:receptor-type adenylate cyclase, putative [Bodo saltans]|uniref:adenylate cyclase n=1 Tax=Bodo saltans TaxID=75058 RepID=A0A0S4JB12_BODSA|nr:receptor-type adenylate cyclase, putative [Bodo saltans]|eukprot:CUG87348.1 receptor-type adenylate cyclase, putative [Bodo saltans]